MRPPPKNRPTIDVLKPWSLYIFLALVVFAFLPAIELEFMEPVARLSGWLGGIAMLIPFVHIGRRCFRYRRIGNMTSWLRWRVAAAYPACFFVLVHSRGHASTWFTYTLLCLVWVVMLSGVIGYFGQKLLYRVMRFVVPREFGMERLETERRRLVALAYDATKHWSVLRGKDLQPTDKPTAAVDFNLLTGPLGEKAGVQLGNIASAISTGAVDKLNAAIEKCTFFEEGIEEADCDLTLFRKRLGSLKKNDHASQLLNDLSLYGTDDDLIAHADGGFRRDYARSFEAFRAHRYRVLAELLWSDKMKRRPSKAIAESEKLIQSTLESPFPGWWWLLQRRALRGGPDNRLQHIKEVFAQQLQRKSANPEQADRSLEDVTEQDIEAVNNLEQLFALRHQLNIEYCFHRVARLWLWIHGPASWALLVFMLEHIYVSLRYGGF